MVNTAPHPSQVGDRPSRGFVYLRQIASLNSWDERLKLSFWIGRTDNQDESESLDLMKALRSFSFD